MASILLAWLSNPFQLQPVIPTPPYPSPPSSPPTLHEHHSYNVAYMTARNLSSEINQAHNPKAEEMAKAIVQYHDICHALGQATAKENTVEDPLMCLPDMETIGHQMKVLGTATGDTARLVTELAGLHRDL
ncbi:hypothetical protein PGTUg99_029952 [Puccinia graminis f. sp. tritici]|uniref:Uncharacterized protein n=1 Tax=Puccinia graminis f. sp. tritici TaxID=56615 RepID=A0A5B0LTR3_PUCGR|nr:hypothetical protein PGTUg99_029952 [Puccinia graminis f. sp. tritici]